MMKNYLVACLALISTSVIGQSRVIDSDKTSFWSAGIDGGGMFFTSSQFTSADFYGYSLPLAGQVYAQYNFNEFFGVKGNIFTGISTGSDGSLLYYEGYYGESDIRATFNFLALQGDDYSGKTRLVLDVGLGGMLFKSNLMQRTNNDVRPNLLTRIPANRGSASLATIIVSGLRFSTAVYNDLDFNIGAQMMMALGNPWLDANREGDQHSDIVVMPFVGISYNLRHVAGKNQVVLNEEKYRSLNNKVAELNQSLEEEKLTREMMSEDHNAMSIALQREMDVLLKEIDSLQLLLADGTQISETVKKSSDQKGDDINVVIAEQGEAKWRVVVGSYPSRELANRFIARTNLSKKQMIVLYSEKLETYRVIYKSFDSLDQAIEARDAAKKEVPDTWIIRL